MLLTYLYSSLKDATDVQLITWMKERKERFLKETFIADGKFFKNVHAKIVFLDPLLLLYL